MVDDKVNVVITSEWRRIIFACPQQHSRALKNILIPYSESVRTVEDSKYRSEVTYYASQKGWILVLADVDVNYLQFYNVPEHKERPYLISPEITNKITFKYSWADTQEPSVKYKYVPETFKEHWNRSEQFRNYIYFCLAVIILTILLCIFYGQP